MPIPATGKYIYESLSCLAATSLGAWMRLCTNRFCKSTWVQRFEKSVLSIKQKLFWSKHRTLQKYIIICTTASSYTHKERYTFRKEDWKRPPGPSVPVPYVHVHITTVILMKRHTFSTSHQFFSYSTEREELWHLAYHILVTVGKNWILSEEILFNAWYTVYTHI